MTTSLEKRNRYESGAELTPGDGAEHPATQVGDRDYEVAFPADRALYTPPIDIYETEEGLVLEADLPGVSIETLDLHVQDNKLTLYGRVQSFVPEGAKLVHQEYGEGDFFRSFILSDEVDHERISAKLNHGVLHIVLPRSQQAEPRKIQVQTD